MEKIEEKLWGGYNTFDNPEMFETLDEIDIWKKIDNLGGSIFWAIHDSGKSWVTNVSTEDLIKKSKQIKSMEIYENDLEITVEYLNQMILDKSEKTRNSKFSEYKIFTEEKLEEMTKECIEFLYNKVKYYIKDI